MNCNICTCGDHGGMQWVRSSAAAAGIYLTKAYERALLSRGVCSRCCPKTWFRGLARQSVPSGSVEWVLYGDI